MNQRDLDILLRRLGLHGLSHDEQLQGLAFVISDVKQAIAELESRDNQRRQHERI